MIFNRLHVRGKMNLLILLPLTALVFVAVPFVITQVNAAQSAAATADAAHNVQALSNLIYQLQRERLVTAGFLVSPEDGEAALRQQQGAAAAAGQNVLNALGPTTSDELAGALTRLGSLTDLRQAALQRGISVDSIARAYHAVIQAIIGAMRLVPQRTSDAEGTRQLTALDALLNANEQSALRGVALIAATVSAQAGQTLLADASSRAEQFIERFVEQADVDQADQVVRVELGDSARQLDVLSKRLPDVHGARAVGEFAAQALSAVDVQSERRHSAQDNVTNEIADSAGARATSARDTAVLIGAGTGLLFVLVAVLTFTLSRSIVLPLRRLTRAATEVADLAGSELARVGDAEDPDQVGPPRLAEIQVVSSDEVGELARAFNRVQATAAALVERQVVSRRNVNLMFTNVAQRTRNLVGRQLGVVDELERKEESAPLLASLYQLDHLATRLRRTAENLLVLAGSQEAARIKRPTALVTLLRGALTEIEDYQRVQFHAVCEVVIGPASASDLMLIFAELLENATSFSPPESKVGVVAELSADGGWCRVSIVDHGIGMKPQRLIDENQRLVERERLDIAPTNVLGLFVVGRLARRHGLTVQLRPTSGGGTTAELMIPALHFHSSAHVPEGSVAVARGRHAAAPGRPIEIATRTNALPASDDTFVWFSGQRAIGSGAQRRGNGHGHAEPHPPVPAGASVTAAPLSAYATTSGPAAWSEPIRAPIAQAPISATAGPPMPAAPHTASAAPQTPVLGRRVPGAHLAPGLADRPRGAASQPVRPGQTRETWRTRDPAADRAKFDSYTEAWSRAGVPPAGLRTHQYPPNVS